MDERLKENRQHGTSLFPCQLYSVYDKNKLISVVPHWHKEVEIVYVERGKISVIINQSEISAKAGEIICINSCELHTIHSLEPNTTHHAIVFLPELLEYKYFDHVEKHYMSPFANGSLRLEHTITDREVNRAASESFMKGVKLFKEKSPSWHFGVKAALAQFFYVVSAAGLMVDNEDVQSEEFEHDMNLLSSIAVYISKNYAKHISLQAIAEEFSMSPNYFCRYFKKCFGQTFVDYLNNVRISHAAYMLQKTDKSVLTVSYECGFENVSYFIQRFRKIYGITPLKYREEEEFTLFEQH